MSIVTLLIILLIIGLLVGGPWAGWHSYGYGPSGIIGVILVVILILVLTGRI